MDDMEIDFDAPLSETYNKLCVRFRELTKRINCGSCLNGLADRHERVQESLNLIERLKEMDRL